MKKLFVLLALLLSIALLSSCAIQIPISEMDDDGGSEEIVELNLWTFPVGNWGNPTAVSNILTSFHKEYPNIHISVQYLNYDTGDAQIDQAVSEGNAPDLVLEGPERLVAAWGSQGWMVDLSDLWESDQAGGIYDNIRAACQSADGAYYEFPICMTAHCMAINYNLFQAAGALEYIDEEAHTWTTQGFINAVHALTAYGQERVATIYCANQSGDQGTRALMTNLYGGSFTDDAHTTYTVDSEENREALQLLCDLEGITFDSSVTATDAINQFYSKETAMCFCWNVSFEVQQALNNPDLDFDIFPLAFPTDQAAPELQGGIWGFGIFDNDSEARSEAAKTFIRYITENEVVYTRAVLASSYWPVRDMDENIYENDMLMTEYSIFMPYMSDYYQITPDWTQARAAWCKVLADIGDGVGVEEAVKDFPASG